MIPVSLKLSNFTSYGENPPELDFDKFHLAAISGTNGAGKSSLLDAITWCLWGSSRAGDSSDALIRLGQSEMNVDFSFKLDDHIFTVKRRRIKKGGGSTALELWSNSHNLTEGTIKATQQKIIDTLHLTFETFSNSSFLRQGHADEFTTKGPTDRKRILADILGLDHYDLLEEKAKEKSKAAQTKIQLLDYKLLEIEAELSQKDEREKALKEIETEGQIVQKELKEKELQIKQVEEEKQTIEKYIHTLKEQQQRFKALKEELEDLKTQSEVKKKAAQEFQQILDQKSIIEENYSKLQKLTQDKKSLEGKRSDLIKVKDALAQIQKIIIEREAKRQEAISSVEIQIKALETENKEHQNQINSLKSQKNICPTCGQNIAEDKNKELYNQNQKLIQGNEAKLTTLKETLKKYQAATLPEYKEAQDKESQIKILEEETKNWSSLNSEILSLDKYSDLYLKLSQAEIAVKTHQEALKDLERIISSREEELSKAALQEEDLNQALTKLSQTQDKLELEQKIREDLNTRVLDLRSKYGEAKQLVSRAEQLENLFKDQQKDKENLTREKEAFEELALAFGKKGIQAMIIEQAIPEIEDEANRLLEKLTEGRMKVTFDTQRETKTKVAGIDGKKEHATVETLDIIISDEMGERPYEMYSGGETFRVNLAIRLAISKLLTHRAGAKLQFLVIDEGFGTQDAPGRARLVEVLDTIKNDYEKILIITHLEELKEEFPTRIEVNKGASGSTFEIVNS